MRMWSRAVAATTLVLVRMPVVHSPPVCSPRRALPAPSQIFQWPPVGRVPHANLTVHEAFTQGGICAQQPGLPGAMRPGLRARFPGGSGTGRLHA
jgi:hypothetical protein